MAETRRRVLVVGGTGVFGSRLVAALLATTDFDVIVAGRDARRLAASVALAAPGRMTSVVMDTRRVTADDLAATGAFAVADTAGPYQFDDFRLAKAAIEARLHYLDLADSRAFIAGFAALDAAAKAAGVVALTGVSTTPALTNAVADALGAGWLRVDAIDIAISPGNRAPRGLSVVRAILSYAGKSVRVFDAGGWAEHPGWGMTIRRAMPGLGKRWFSLVDTPDLDILPARFAVTRSVLFRAGLELSPLHLGLLAASLPVRWGLLPTLAPLAPLFRWLASLTVALGTDRGGMTVDVTGLDGDGRPASARWSMLAEAGDGPNVPILPMLATLRLLATESISSRASACVGVLTLAEIEVEFSNYRITSQQSAW